MLLYSPFIIANYYKYFFMPMSHPKHKLPLSTTTTKNQKNLKKNDWNKTKDILNFNRDKMDWPLLAHGTEWGGRDQF